jgi:anion-transporting  ArsA/GET3 family ATPase
VLLIEVEGRQGIARLFDVPQLPYDERKIAAGVGGGDLFALAVDPEGALLDYLEMFYNLRRMGKTLTKMGMVDFATTIAPGLSDVLVTGKATEAARRRKAGVHVYDNVVMDAPPTGRIGRFLNVTTEVSDLAKMGPIRNHADTVAGVIRSPQTAVHFVSTLEEMPVQETLDGIAELREMGDIQVGGIVVNMARPALIDDPDVTINADMLATSLKAAGLNGDPELPSALAAELTEHAEQIAAQDAARTELELAGHPIYELPLLTEGIDLAGLYKLAAELRDQGAA